jgi:serine/threonine-protein phosphatase 2B catalytic subunit
VYKNKGALAIIRDNKLSIQKFNEVPHPFVLANYMDCLEFSMPGVCQLVGKILIYLLRSKRKSRK